MDQIQQLIVDTYVAKPKHFVQILKRNNQVLEYLNIHCSHIDNFLEKLYYAVHRVTSECEYGSKRTLKSFSGYTFCGKPGVCKCARQSISASVSSSKLAMSAEQKLKIQEKRLKTTLDRYGVVNTGLLEVSRKQHQTFYDNKQLVDATVVKIQNTKKERYGSKNFNNRKKAETTCVSKYGIKNTWLLTQDNQNPLLIQLKDRAQLTLLYPEKSVEEIAHYLNVHVQTVYYYLNLHNLREPYKSTFEKEIIFFLNSLGVTNIITNSRSIISKELDIFLPDYNLAIEYNGIYWHHDRVPHITKSYHRDKFLSCEEKGIELFTIFGDSWQSKKEIWKKKIKSKIGILDEKVHARKCKIVELTSASTKSFLNENHIQGYCTSQYCYGLEYNNRLVAVMTFSKKRAGIGKDRGNNSYELVRYATACTVMGGASRLLAVFVKSKNPVTIFSYSDNQYSVGKLYKQLGFTLEKSGSAGYKYYDVGEKKMYHRYVFAKHNLVRQGCDPKLTEFEIMDSRGFLRIWDCGSKTWCLNF